MGRRVSLRWRAIPGVLALTGCVAGASAPSPTDPHDPATSAVSPVTTTTLTVEDGLATFRSCLAEFGVIIDEIPLDGLGRPRMAIALSGLDLTDRTILGAVDRCAASLSKGALDLGFDPELRDLVVARLGSLASCVRSLGVADFPDPLPGFDGVGSPFPVNRIPWDDPGLGPALAVCNDGPT